MKVALALVASQDNIAPEAAQIQLPVLLELTGVVMQPQYHHIAYHAPADSLQIWMVPGIVLVVQVVIIALMHFQRQPFAPKDTLVHRILVHAHSVRLEHMLLSRDHQVAQLVLQVMLVLNETKVR